MNHISINDKYYVSFPDLKLIDELKEKEHYKKYPKAFLKKFTDLSTEDIEEICKDKVLALDLVNTIYDRLDITKESTFISKVNQAYSAFNKIDMIFFVVLHYTYGIPLEQLIDKDIKELIMLFIIESQMHSKDGEALERVCSNLKHFYSEKTVEDFKKLCIVEKTAEEQMQEWNEEFSQFSQL